MTCEEAERGASENQLQAGPGGSRRAGDGRNQLMCGQWARQGQGPSSQRWGSLRCPARGGTREESWE